MSLIRYSFVLLCIVIISACASSKSNKLKPSVKISGPTLCRSIQDKGEIALPQEATNSFSPYDKQVVAHLLFENFSGNYNMHWEWYEPEGELYYSSNPIPLKTSKGTYVKQATAWHSLTVEGDKASTLSGQWKVKFLLNDELYASTPFQIKHPSMVVPPPPARNTKLSPNDWGVIIGIENYSRLPSATYAKKDALIIKSYFHNVLGIPEENLIFLIDSNATKARIEGYMERYLPINVRSDSTVYVYFSGHGSPDINTGDPYLVLHDGDPRFLEKTGYKIRKLYSDLNNLKIKRSYVFLDACFSGVARDAAEMLLQERPLLFHVDDVHLNSDAVISMSATSATQTSLTHKDGEHGLFTFYLLRALYGEADINNDRKVTIKETYDYVSKNVTNMAKREGKDQTPEITPPVELLEGQNFSRITW